MNQLKCSSLSPLRRERTRCGLTQLELAVRAGCSLNSVSLAERGGRLSAQLAERFASALKVPIKALAPVESRTGEPEPAVPLCGNSPTAPR